MGSETDSEADRGTDTADDSAGDGKDSQEYVDRSKIDFDPDDGLYTGTAVEGTSDIPGSTSSDHDDEAEGDAEGEDDPEQADPEPA